MSDMFNRIADLSPQKREFLMKLLKSRGLDPSQLPIVPRAGDRSTAALSFAQQRLWFLNQLEPGNPFYNVPTVVRFRGPLDSSAFERALNAIVQRHEALRTVFPIVAGQPVQRILPALHVPLSIVDIPGADLVKDLARDEIQRPFDLQHGPLLRAVLLRLQPQEHVLVLTLHHIVSDGWSMKIFIQELAMLYQDLSAGDQPHLPALPIQYADYAVWQREWMQGEMLAAQIDYWKAQLQPEGTSLPTLDLPTDYPRPPIQSFRGGRRLFMLPKSGSAALSALAQAQGVTLFMLLLAAWQVLLARYTRQSEIVVGSPVAGRHRLEIEGLIGCFINTLVLRTDLSGNPSFRELLARVRQMCLQAYAHQDLPFEKLVEELQPTRDLSRQPLFQTMFILQDDPMGSSDLTDLTLEPLIIENGTSQFDLTLSVVDTLDGLVGTIEYSSDLFAATTIERMAEHFQTLLAGIVADPERRLSDLPLLTPSERRQLAEWNATSVDYPTDLCLHTLIEAQIQRTPDAATVVFEGASLTFGELDRRANQLARHLQMLGVKPESRVGVCLNRSLELVVALLAILKAGAAYLPLDPAYPGERLAFMLGDAQAQALITSQQFASHFQAAEHQLPALVDLDTDWTMIAQQPANAPTSAVTPDHAAYVIYTSGSTGQPKGVVNTHRAIVNRLLWMQDAYRLDATDRVLQKTPYSFDVSVWEFFWPLLTGATLVVARPEGHKDPAYLARLIVEQQITTLHFVPSMLRLFLEQPDLETCRSLRRVICSGEALPSDMQEHFFERIDAELHNLYGPTEAAVDVSAWACQPDTALQSVPIGRPIANIQIHLLDPQLQPVPVGVPGELHIGGVGLARGYLNRPDLTAERFIPDPFSRPEGTRPGSRLYRTGDLARYRPDGAIEFLGRLDHQVKLRGFRIELGEIEAALAEHPDVHASVVVLRVSQSDARLVAYVVGEQKNKEQRNKEQRETGTPPSPVATGYPLGAGGRGDEGLTKEPRTKNQEPNEEQSSTTTPPRLPQRERGPGGEGLTSTLRAFLQSRLPDYMIPSAFVLLDALPLSPNGKLDLRALPDPDGLRPAAEASYVAPQSEIEQQIAAIWQAALGIDRVGVHDNFFDLGGHSLLLIQIHRRLIETVAPNLAVVDLFQYPTISALARHIASASSAPPAPQQAQDRAATRLETMRQQRQFRQRSQSTKKPPR